MIELEQSRQSLLNEKRQLEETISMLQLRINNLEIDNKAVSRHNFGELLFRFHFKI